ncbi:hypothetical protein EK21DRAFT_106860 [Setomelanomma holmii]|uniref:DUF7918 domain-containing protein n=1 Tax=Setomelanomma holmii TaxID=210430 RepID=A0A9P4HKQ9_9PLEO|nr:hypothetical protein EK21DRAFT_106860 [Setomelanomma holmii]
MAIHPNTKYNNDKSAINLTTVTKCVEAAAGSEFAIMYSFDDTFPDTKDLRASCYLDGSVVRRSIIRRSIFGGHKEYDITALPTKVWGQWRLRNFQFQDLSIVEEDGPGVDYEVTETPDNLGTIKLEFDFALSEVFDVTLKGDAQSLRLGLGSERNTKKLPTGKFEKANGGPFATFIFKYRSRADLQALHILPRELSPAPIEKVKASLGSPLLPEEQEDVEVQDEPADQPVSGSAGCQQTANSAQSAQSSSSIPPPHALEAFLAPNIRGSSLASLLSTQISNPDVRLQPSIASTQPEPTGLTKTDLPILIKHYRGTSEGSRKSIRERSGYLACINEDKNDIPIKREEMGDGEVIMRIKRERNDSTTTRGRQKRQKNEVIVLDD